MPQKKPVKIMIIFGTRPEAIKMAPVVLEMKKYSEFIRPLVVVTAQHREMLDQVLNLFSIKPDYDLDIMYEGQTLFDITNHALLKLDKILAEENPNLVLVHGDTTTTFAGALAAFYHKTAIAHVEAGLRTKNKYSPFPEEMNRKLTGVLSDYHFAPTKTARDNLLSEGIAPEKIFVAGNTVIDALQITVKENYQFEFASKELKDALALEKKIILVTTHRRENLGAPMSQIYQALAEIIAEFEEEAQIIFPVHKNNLVRQAAEKELGDIRGITLLEPLDYEPFANLMARSYLILTDSGGVQEEAPALGKPVLVLRDTTERPEAVKAGTVKIVGAEKEKIYRETKLLLTDESAYLKMANAVNPYGDGLAAKRIIGKILAGYGLKEESPCEF